MDHMRDRDVETREVIDEIIVLVTSLVPALLFLVGYGIVVADGVISKGLLYLLGAAFIIDLISEAWIVRSPLGHDSALLDRLIAVHALGTVVGYLVLAAVVTELVPAFFGYSVFLLLWLVGFLVGEGIIVFIDDRFEALRDVGTGIEEDLF